MAKAEYRAARRSRKEPRVGRLQVTERIFFPSIDIGETKWGIWHQLASIVGHANSVNELRAWSYSQINDMELVHNISIIGLHGMTRCAGQRQHGDIGER